MPRNRLRKLWLAAHLYLGLILGAPLAVIGLSGSLIVFGWPLDAWLNRELMRVEAPPNTQPRPLQDIIASARASLPPNADPLDSLTFPKHNNAVFRASYHLPPARDSYEIFIDPYTAKIVGQRLWGDFDRCCSWHGPLMTVIYRLHDSFWLGETGQILVGSIGLLMLLSLLSGMVLWWPNPGHWRAALTWKAHTSPQRRVYDLHKLTGVYTLPVLAMLLFTGAYLDFPKPSQAIVNSVSPLTQIPENLKSNPATGRIALNADEAIARWRDFFPNAILDSMDFPVSTDDYYRFYFFSGTEIMPEIPEGVAYLDQYNGSWLYISDAQHRSAGDIFHAWQFNLHSGQAFGLTGQILVFLSGFAPAILYVSGLMRWLQKRRAHKLRPINEDTKPAWSPHFRLRRGGKALKSCRLKCVLQTLCWWIS